MAYVNLFGGKRLILVKEIASMSKLLVFDLGYVVSTSLFGVLVMTAGVESAVFAGLVLLASVVARVAAARPRMNGVLGAVYCMTPIISGYFVALLRPEYKDLAFSAGQMTSVAVLVVLAWVTFRDRSRPLNEYLFGALAGALALGAIPVMNGFSPAYVLVAYVALALYGILWVGEKSPVVKIAAGVPRMNERIKIGVTGIDYVSFWASHDVASKVKKYGGLVGIAENLWYLSVDGRYDVKDVIDYLESL